MTEELAAIWPTDRVLLHNDFHLLNAVQQRCVGPLAGLWDFSCVAAGPAAFDLRYFEGSLHGP